MRTAILRCRFLPPVQIISRSAPKMFRLSPKQKRLIVRANLEMSKCDAAELAALAKGLREELDKPNVNVLSLEVMNRIDKIEKLAKKIREETKGF